MTAAATDDVRGTLRALWRRAPLWRLAVCACALLSLLCVCFPPRVTVAPPPAPPPNIDTAFYTDVAPPLAPQSAAGPIPVVRPATPAPPPRARAPDVPPVPPGPPTAANGAPQPAQLSLATAGGPPAPTLSGIDAALLGRTYRDVIQINGFQLPLPDGEWALLANGTVKAKVDPNNTGFTYFFGRIEHRELVGAVIATAMRSPGSPGTGFAKFEGCDNADNIYTMKEEMTEFGHQSCWIEHNLFTPPWQQWGDKATSLNNLQRAAAGDMAAKGVTYPQDFVGLHFLRAETWGKLEAAYYFSPEAAHLKGAVALSVRDTDWYGPNLRRFPDKLAYAQKLQAWAEGFWPKFTRAFDAGRPAPQPLPSAAR